MSDMKQVLEGLGMKCAKLIPSEVCAEGSEHEFNFMMHVDGSDSYSNYFKCSHCGEIIVRTQKRTGLDKSLWDARD